MKLDIDAKLHHKIAAKIVPDPDAKSDNFVPFVTWFFGAIFTVIAIVSFLFAMFGSDPWTPTILCSGAAVLLLGGGELLWRSATKHHMWNYYSKQATNIYKNLMPQNQEIAAPLVRKIYQLERIDHLDSERVVRERINLIEKIKEKDRKERLDLLIHTDDTDMYAVKALLEGYKQLP